MRRMINRTGPPLVLLIGLFSAQPCLADISYNVDIVFIGIMTFVPGASRVTVIMPNLTDGIDDAGDDHHSVDGHVPYILTDKTTMPATDPINRKHDFLRAANDGLHYHYVLLRGEEIAVDGSNNVSALNSPLVYKNTGSGPCPVKDDAHPDLDTTKSLYWLSSLQNILGTSQVQDQPHFDAIPNHGVVISRADLKYGSLEAHVIKPGVKWDFTKIQPNGQPGDIVYTQALAQEVHWIFKASGEPFVLNLNGFDGTGRRLAFKPQNGWVIIVVGNTLAKETGYLQAPGNPPERDQHYSAYYQFIKDNSQGAGPLPIPRDPDADNCPVYWVATLQQGGPKIPPPPTVEQAHASAKQQAKNAKHPKKKNVTGMDMGPQPTPGGLNCSGDQWP